MSKNQRALVKEALSYWKLGLEDPVYFIENFCKLKDQKAGKAIPFKLWPAQRWQLYYWQTNQRCITLKSRQIGITWLALAFGLWKMCRQKYFEGIIVSRKESAAISALDKLKFMYNHLPDLIKNHVIPKTGDTRLLLELGTIEGRFVAESANPEAGRSDTLNYLIMDEAAFMPDAHSIWTAAQPALSRTSGNAIIISTANGHDSFFQPVYSKGADKMNGFHANFISWKGDPDRTQEWYNNAEREALNNGIEFSKKFRQEYPKDPIEAFLVTGECVFSGDMVSDYLNMKPFACTVGHIDTKRKFTADHNGPFTIYERPNPNHKYCIGVDCSEGLEKGDWSVAAVYNRTTCEQVAELRTHMDTDLFGKTVNAIGWMYNKAMLNIEMNNMGESVLNVLHKQLHYPSIYKQMRYDGHSSKKVKKLGWRTTATSKPLMIDTLNSLLREHEMMPKSRKLFEEMNTFVRKDAGMSSRMGALGNNHDDAVIAHSLAAIMLAEMPMIQSVSQNRPAVYQPLARVSYSDIPDRNTVLKTA